MRDHGATSTTVATAPPPVDGLHLPKALAETVLELGALGLDELELAPGLLGQLDELEAERPHRRRQLGDLRAERDPDPIVIPGGIAEGQRPAPGGSADESCRKCDFSDEAVGALGPVDGLFGQAWRGHGGA